MRIDLHTHSSVSDGTEPPAELVASAAAARLDVIALTDHDTTAGWTEAAQAAVRHGVVLVPGTEVSALSRGVSVHLLSYLQDPADPALADVLARTRDARLHRGRAIVERLAEDYPLTWDDVVARHTPGTVVGRPHVADALVALGVVPDRTAAFADLLSARGRYYVPYYAPEAVEAVEAIRASGGVPVFAHPGADGRGRVVPDSDIAELAEAGLAGLEVHHRDHTPEQRERLTALADRLGLLVTGSSDYHGTGKDNLLGENLTSPEALAEIERQGRTAVVGR
ncbi:PHP domain-containing protein [Cellulomonas triticagri]|uniref:PHP domain-containing protein n=1 Tax=Cellulomonas triticagri TaxID=2483352 RepID=A0A3M2IUI1_9CELL|nr:PHP domain-containing protein [Cellulomonas triticagri]RMI03340.1 PHP domain-containing protein [Cellulomonas triticagri]